MERRHIRIARAAAFASAAALALFAASCAVAPPRPTPPEPIVEPAVEPSPEEKARLELEAIHGLLSGGRMDEALGRLEALAAAWPENRDYPLLRASILLSMDRLGEARALARAAADGLEAREALPALLLQSEIERFAGDARAQRAILDQILTVDPRHAEANVSMGGLHYDAKNYRAAEEAYRTALAAAPDFPDALVGLARAQFRRGDQRGALASLDRAVAAAPNDAIVRLDRSRVLYELGRYAECEAELDEAIRLAPQSAWTYLERGILYFDTGRAALAEADLSKSIELNASYFLPYVYRASIREQAGRDEEALADYAQVARLQPDYWFSFESIGALNYRLGRWLEAHAAFDKAAAATPNHPEYYVAAGVSLLRAGQARAAKDYASRALPRINRETYPGYWLAMRLVFDQTDMSSELELQINRTRSLDTKASLLYYLGAYWVGRGRTELGLRFIQMSYDENRVGTVERRLAEADLKRLGQ